MTSPFQLARKHIETSPLIKNASSSTKLELYGLFKQATESDCDDANAPSSFNFVARAKFDAWRKFKGMSKEEAENHYVEAVKRLDPSFVLPQNNTNTNINVQTQNMNHSNYDKKKNQSTISEALEPTTTLAIPNGNGNYHHQQPDQQTSSSLLVVLQQPSSKKKQSNSRVVEMIVQSSLPLRTPNRQKLDRLGVLSPLLSENDLDVAVANVLNHQQPQQQQPNQSFLSNTTTTTTHVNHSSQNGFSTATTTTITSSPLPPPTTLLSTKSSHSSKQQLSSTTTMTTTTTRSLHMPSVGNVRDLGSLPGLTHDGKPGTIKPQRLFRSAHMDDITKSDAELLLQTLGVRTIVDLRSPPAPSAPTVGDAPQTLSQDNHELFRYFELIEPNILIQQQQQSSSQLSTLSRRLRTFIPAFSRSTGQRMATYHMSPLQKLTALFYKIISIMVAILRKLIDIFGFLPPLQFIAHRLIQFEQYLHQRMVGIGIEALSRTNLAALYYQIMTTETFALKQALTVLSHNQNQPALFACHFGKDRTGVVAALVLHALGTPREILIQDYLESRYHVESARGELEWQRQLAASQGRIPIAWKGVPEDAMELALSQIEKEYGSLDEYLKIKLELGEQWKKALREELVEPIT
jgi:protein tyrosine/serine phosphatase/acyl-CoA-binding protein